MSRSRYRTPPDSATPPSPGSGLDASEPVGSTGTLAALLAIALGAVLAYSNTFDASFHFDDEASIARNGNLRDLRSFWPPSGSRWLGFLSFALNYRLGGLEVFGYHLANLFIHVSNGLLVFWLTAMTLRTPALRSARAGSVLRRYLPLAAGLLFALHPVQTQAVTYIAQRFTSLATLFYLLSFALYAHGRLSLEAERPARARAAWLYGLSVVAAAAAMETKQISFTLPFVAVGYEVLFFGSGRRTFLLAPLAATALLVPLGLAREGERLGDVLGDVSRFAAETREIPRSVYLLTQSRVVVRYLRLLVLPAGQNLDYDFALSHSLAEPGVLLALTVLVAVLSLAVFLLIRARRTNCAPGQLVFSGIAWFFVTLSVESSVIPITDVIFEHRMYLPSVGAAIAMGTALLWAVERMRLQARPALQVTCALFVVAGPLGVATYARNRVWRNELTLWTDVVEKSPRKARARNNIGVVYKDAGRLDDAIRELREAIRLNPEYPEAHNNLGAAYGARGLIDDAMREWLEAIRLADRYAEAHNNLGAAYAAKGQLDDAMREWRAASRLDPAYPAPHVNLGVAYRSMGRYDDAVRELREAIRLDPGHAKAHRTLGAVYEARGQLDDAAREYREAIRFNPRNPLSDEDVRRVLPK